MFDSFSRERQAQRCAVGEGSWIRLDFLVSQVERRRRRRMIEGGGRGEGEEEEEEEDEDEEEY